MKAAALLVPCLLALAGSAFCQTAQPELLRQSVAASTSPTASWQTSFSPQMISNLKTFAADAPAPKGCRPVMVGRDKVPVHSAGESLYAGVQCVSALPAGIDRGLEARAGLPNGLKPASAAASPASMNLDPPSPSAAVPADQP